MNKQTKNAIIAIVIIIAIILLIVILASPNKSPGLVDAQTAQCIANNSHLYVQAGCPACKAQEDMFGKNYKYINSTDCRSNTQECITKNITATPTWKIRNQTYVGVQTIDQLKNYTGCKFNSNNSNSS